MNLLSKTLWKNTALSVLTRHDANLLRIFWETSNSRQYNTGSTESQQSNFYKDFVWWCPKTYHEYSRRFQKWKNRIKKSFWRCVTSIKMFHSSKWVRIYLFFFNQQDLKSKYLIHEFKHSMGFTNFFRRLIFELFFFANADVVTIKDVTSKENSRNQCRSN